MVETLKLGENITSTTSSLYNMNEIWELRRHRDGLIEHYHSQQQRMPTTTKKNKTKTSN